MKILILDQHGDVTTSLLHQLGALGYEVFIADSSIIPLKKWDKETIQNNEYHHPYQIGDIDQLQTGEFDAFISLSHDFYHRLSSLSPKTKAIYFNTQPNKPLYPVTFDNILSCDSRNVPEGACLYALTLPFELHQYHGPDPNGDYIQIIFDFTKMAKEPHRIQAWHIFDMARRNYKGDRKIITYGDPGKSIRDTDAFPNMFAQLHIKNWGSGNDYAILKGMLRGIPPILYRPFVHGSIIDQFIGDGEAFFFEDGFELTDLLEEIDTQFTLVKQKGILASARTAKFMLDPTHLERLADFFGSLK